MYTDCMRFLPSPEASSIEDVAFQTGPARVMTYLTSRADYDATMVAGNEMMTEENAQTAPTVFEEFTVELMGAWSGISAVGLSFATVTALLSF